MEQIFRDGLFAGSRVLITGGGTGLGRAMAQRLIGLGASIEIWGRRAPVLEQAAAEMGERVTWRAVNIKDADAVEAAVASSYAEGRPYTHLINNAAGRNDSEVISSSVWTFSE